MHSKDPLFSSKLKMVLSVIFWGGSFIATKIAVRQFSPVAVVWLRFLIGILCLFPIILHKGMLHISGWKELAEYFLLGFLGITLHQWLQSNGLVTSQASTTAWIVASTPLFMVIFSGLLLKEKLGNWGVFGIVLATLGVLLVVSNGDIGDIFRNGFGAPGNFYVLLSAPNWAIYSILLSRTLKHHSVWETTFFSMLAGWLFTSIQFLVGKGWQSFNALAPSGWVSVLYLGIFCTFLAYIFYYDALRNLTSASVGAYLYIEPIATMFIAFLVLAEPITLPSLLGGTLIIIGISLVNKRSPAGRTTVEESADIIPME